MLDYGSLEKKYNLPSGLLKAVATTETGGHPDPDRAISHSGAIGRMQLMPKTAKSLGVDPYNPDQNLEGGAKYLAHLISITGDVKKGVTAYNYGIGNLRKAERNAEITGMGYEKFITKKESAEYFDKVQKNLAVQGVQKVEDNFMQPLVGENLKHWTWEDKQAIGGA